MCLIDNLSHKEYVVKKKINRRKKDIVYMNHMDYVYLREHESVESG